MYTCNLAGPCISGDHGLQHLPMSTTAWGLLSTNRVCPRHGISSCPLLLQHILLRHSHLHKTTHSWCLSKGICWTSKLMPEVMYPELISAQSLVIQTFAALSLRADRCCCYNVLVCFSRQGFPVQLRPTSHPLCSSSLTWKYGRCTPKRWDYRCVPPYRASAFLSILRHGTID